MRDLPEPTEDDDISCHLQQIGMGSLLCSAARQTGDRTTNEVEPSMCFNCEAGKIFREVGCDAVLPKVLILPNTGGAGFQVESLLCKIRKRYTNIDYCKQCKLVTAETTRTLITSTRGIFEAQGFYAAYKDIEKARLSLRDGNFDNAITRSISCFESVMRICHEKLNKPLPAKKQISDLWKSTRNILGFSKIDPTDLTLNLMNTLSGAVTQLGSLRNSLSDAHGKSNLSHAASESLAEIAINTSSTLSTYIIRVFNETSGGVS